MNWIHFILRLRGVWITSAEPGTFFTSFLRSLSYPFRPPIWRRAAIAWPELGTAVRILRWIFTCFLLSMFISHFHPAAASAGVKTRGESISTALNEVILVRCLPDEWMNVFLPFRWVRAARFYLEQHMYRATHSHVAHFVIHMEEKREESS